MKPRVDGAKKTILAISLAASLIAMSPLRADEIPFPSGLDTDAAFLARISGLFRTEDPTSIYDFDVYDQNVEFVLDGTWSIDLTSGLTMSFGTTAQSLGFILPVFTQEVDLTTWVFINREWYFEAAFAEKFAKNSVAFGYIGGESSPIKHARIGNSGIAFPTDYPFVEIGGGKVIAPGVMATFAGDRWSADAIVRYDAVTPRELILNGMNEVTDEYVPVTSYVDGKWFVLPDETVNGGATVYVEDDAGAIVESGTPTAGRRWRKLNAAEYVLTGSTGTLKLTTSATGAVAILYNGSYATGGGAADATLTNFVNDTKLAFDGWALARSRAMPAGYLPDAADPGYAAEMAARFIVQLEGQYALIVRERGRFSPFAVLSRYAAVSPKPAPVFRSSGTIPTYLGASDFDGANVELHRSDAGTSTGIPTARSAEARFPLAKEFPLLYLPSFGGQKPDTDLCVRARSWQEISSISLGANAMPGTIEVRRDGVRDDGFTFDANTGLLSLLKTPTSSETVRITWMDCDTTARNASLTLGAGARWNPFDPLTFKIATAFRWNVSQNGYTDSSATSPGSLVVSAGTEWKGDDLVANTAFAFELSMPDTTGYYRILGMDDAASVFYPSKDWYERTPTAIVPEIAGVTLDVNNRVELTGTSGTELPTVSDSSVGGTTLSFFCDLTGTGAWASADILAGSKGSAEFRSARTLTISLKNVGTTDAYRLFLQLGMGESDYFENADTVRTKELTPPAVGAGWKTLEIDLTDDDRTALASGCDMRLVAVYPTTGATPIDVRLYSGPFETIAAGFSPYLISPVPVTANSGASAREVADPANPSLSSKWASLLQRLNGGSVNTVLKAEFTPDAIGQTYSLGANVGPLPIDRYKTLAFFINPQLLPADMNGTNAPIRISFAKPGTNVLSESTAMEISVDASALKTGWQEIAVDMDARTLSIDGTVIPSATVTIYDRTIEPTSIRIMLDDWSVPGSTFTPPNYAYSLLIDEIHLRDPISSVGLRNRTEVSWGKKGALLSIGGDTSPFSIISDPVFGVVAQTYKELSSADPIVSGTARAGVTLLSARIDGSVAASSETADILDAASHSFSVPLGPIAITESFAAGFDKGTMTRNDAISLSGPIAASAALTLREESRRLERTMGGKVSASLPALPIGGFSISASSNFSQEGTAPKPELTGVSWGSLWTDSFAYSLSLGEANASRRAGKTATSLSWQAPGEKGSTMGLAGISLEGSGESRYVSATSTTLDGVTSLTLSFPFAFGFTTVTPSWKREATRRGFPATGGAYSSDTDFLLTSISGQSWLFGVPPIADIVDGGVEPSLRGAGTYSHGFTNKYAITISRTSTGRLSDLVIPSSFDVSIARDTESDATDASFLDERALSLKIGLSAMNVAGKLGTVRVFDWYEQDEIAQLYAYGYKWGIGYATWYVDASHTILLFLSDQGTVSLENAFHHNSPDVAGKNRLTSDTARFIWKRPGKGNFVASLLLDFASIPSVTKREDSLSCTASATDSGLSVGFDVDHVARTLIGNNAEIHVSCGFGLDGTEKGLKAAEIRVGVGGKLSF